MKAMTVYEAAKLVKDHFRATVPSNTVQIQAVFGVSGTGEILKFESEEQAMNLNSADGFIFRTMYREGNIDVTPITYELIKH